MSTQNNLIIVIGSAKQHRAQIIYIYIYIHTHITVILGGYHRTKKTERRKKRGEVFQKTKCMLLLWRKISLDNLNMQTWRRGLKKISGVQFPSLTPCSAECTSKMTVLSPDRNCFLLAKKFLISEHNNMQSFSNVKLLPFFLMFSFWIQMTSTPIHMLSVLTKASVQFKWIAWLSEIAWLNFNSGCLDNAIQSSEL
jgi:hypothetical protein